jgi:N-acetylmuramoyl-L-alanine amidase
MTFTNESYDRVLFAIAIWRESRGEPLEAKRAVAHVILNRVKSPGWPDRVSEVILQPWQFSAFNRADPNSTKWPNATDPAWLECCAVVDDPGTDPTGGAVLYHSRIINMPKWAVPEKRTAQIGAFTFYRA